MMVTGWTRLAAVWLLGMPSAAGATLTASGGMAHRPMSRGSSPTSAVTVLRPSCSWISTVTQKSSLDGRGGGLGIAGPRPANACRQPRPHTMGES